MQRHIAEIHSWLKCIQCHFPSRMHEHCINIYCGTFILQLYAQTSQTTMSFHKPFVNRPKVQSLRPASFICTGLSSPTADPLHVALYALRGTQLFQLKRSAAAASSNLWQTVGHLCLICEYENDLLVCTVQKIMKSTKQRMQQTTPLNSALLFTAHMFVQTFFFPFQTHQHSSLSNTSCIHVYTFGNSFRLQRFSHKNFPAQSTF